MISLDTYLEGLYVMGGMGLFFSAFIIAMNRDVYGADSKQFHKTLAIIGIVLPAIAAWPLTLALIAVCLALAIPAGIVYVMMHSFKYFVKKEYS